MRNYIPRFAAILIISSAASLSLSVDAAGGENWPVFLGPAANGHADATDLPLTWSETENIVWKTAIHGRGWSSPVVWKNQIWLTTATADGKEMFVVCADLATGKILHDVKVFDVQLPDKIASVNSYASPTPCVEEGRVYAHFGTYGTVCLDTATGRPVWSRRDLKCIHHMGPGSSPILFENLMIFNVDGCDVQYVIALDKATGRTAWKTDRRVDFTDIPWYRRKSYTTPIVITHDERRQLISACAYGIFSYDPSTGKEFWKITHRGWSLTPRPVYAHGLVYQVMDFDFPELWALKPEGSGDRPASDVVWKLTKGSPQTPSFTVVDDLLYLVSDDGIAQVLDAKTGESIWRKRMSGDYSASLVYADGRVHFFSEDGTTTVIAPGRECEVLATNELDAPIKATPAVVGRSFILRTADHLYRIEKK